MFMEPKKVEPKHRKDEKDVLELFTESVRDPKKAGRMASVNLPFFLMGGVNRKSVIDGDGMSFLSSRKPEQSSSRS